MSLERLDQDDVPAAPGLNVGSSRMRIDADEFLMGRARYIADYADDSTCHVAIVRSPHARARIRGYDVTAARGLPGVHLVLTGDEAAVHAGPIPYFIDPAARGGKGAEQRCLAHGRVRYAGEPVAAVVAQDRVTAGHAADLVVVHYDVEEPVLDADAALAEDAPAVFDEVPGNVMLDRSLVSGDARARIDSARYRIRLEFSIHRSTTAPIEPRGYLAEWDDARQSMIMWGSLQNPQALRWQVSAALGLDESQFRAITARVGGSFGLKMQGSPEETLVALCAKLSNLPVMWLESRRETLLVGAREQIHRLEAGFDETGRVLGLCDDIVANVGAASAQPGWAMANNSGLTMPTGYDVQDVDVRVRAVVSNKGPWNSARGFGKDGANIAMERLMDAVAERLGLHPLDVRRVNYIHAADFPYRTSGGLNVDSGDYHALTDLLEQSLGEPGWREEQAKARAEGRFIGIGYGFELTPESADGPGTFIGGFDTTTVRLQPDGTVKVLTGVTTPGGGNETGIAQVVADELGVRLGDIEVIQGDTDLCPYGFGNFSGRSMLVGGGSAALAARDLRAKLDLVGARMLGVGPDDVVASESFVRVRTDPSRAVAVRQVIHAILTRAFEVADEVEPVLESTRSYKPDNIDHRPDSQGRLQPYPTYSNGICAVVVDVDSATGTLKILDVVLAHDCGTMVNPALVEGQAHGALAMGLGSAWTESQPFTPEGVCVADRFKTYLMMRAEDLPEFRLVHQVTPSPFTLLGNKGAGEAGVGSSMAAMTAAVEDALRPLGVTISALPLSPELLLERVRAAGEVSA